MEQQSEMEAQQTTIAAVKPQRAMFRVATIRIRRASESDDL